MRRTLFVFAVLLGFTLLAGCGKEFNESFCKQYKTSFIQSCTDVCTKKSGQAEICGTKCAEALPNDTTFKAKCGGTSAATVPAATTTTAAPGDPAGAGSTTH